MRGGCVKYSVWVRISNSHEKLAYIMSTDCGVHGDGYEDLMKEGVTYGASGVWFDGRKWSLRCVGCEVESFVREVSCEGGIGKMDRLCVWVEMWEMFVLMSAFG